jgi:hypothetical protein
VHRSSGDHEELSDTSLVVLPRCLLMGLVRAIVAGPQRCDGAVLMATGSAHHRVVLLPDLPHREASRAVVTTSIWFKETVAAG